MQVHKLRAAATGQTEMPILLIHFIDRQMRRCARDLMYAIIIISNNN